MSYIGVSMAKHHSFATAAEVEDRAVTTRPSSTANFYVDSLDKVPGASSGDFTINKNQSLFNGFFHRIAVNEVVMDWGLPNVAEWWGNNFIIVGVDDGSGPLATTYVVTIDQGFYSILEVLNAIVTQLNAAPGQTATFSVGTSSSQVGLLATQDFIIYYPQVATDPLIPAGSAPNYDRAYYLGRALFSSDQMYANSVMPAPIIAPQFNSIYPIVSPLVLGTRYVDIVSTQLTYNQDLKDSTTAQYQRDVLYRWYFAWSEQSQVEQLAGPPTVYPFYVIQGYKAFNQRRVLPYPKQIRWDNSQPIGQVSFQSYDDRGRLIDVTKFTPNANYNFQMSMLLSEN